MVEEIISKVWQIHGTLTVATPALLILNDGKVVFVTEGGDNKKKRCWMLDTGC